MKSFIFRITQCSVTLPCDRIFFFFIWSVGSVGVSFVIFEAGIHLLLSRFQGIESEQQRPWTVVTSWAEFPKPLILTSLTCWTLLVLSESKRSACTKLRPEKRFSSPSQSVAQFYLFTALLDSCTTMQFLAFTTSVYRTRRKFIFGMKSRANQTT